MVNTVEEILCPACGKKMKKIFIPDELINVDICADGCGGIFFDNRELEKFDEKDESIDNICNELNNKIFETVDDIAVRICPVCDVKMNKVFASPLKKIQIDECYKCGGKFLDYGELEKIRDEFDSNQECSEYLLSEFYNDKGDIIKQTEEEARNAKNNKSILKRLFDKMIGL